MMNRNKWYFPAIFLVSIAYGIENLRIAVIPKTKENMVTMLITGSGYKLDSTMFSFSVPMNSDSAFAIQTNQADPIKFIPAKISKKNNSMFINVEKVKPSFAYMINVFPEKVENEYYFYYNMNFSDSVNRLEFETREPRGISRFDINGINQLTKIEESDFIIHIGIKEKININDTTEIIIKYGDEEKDGISKNNQGDKNSTPVLGINDSKNKEIKRYKLYSWEALTSVIIIFLFSCFVIRYNILYKEKN